MSEEIKIEAIQKTRRSAIKTAAQVAVTAPAVGLLLSAGTKAASARIHYGDDAIVSHNTGDDNSYDSSNTVIKSGDDYFTF